MIDDQKMPPDPDCADVPPELLALDGKQVTVTDADGSITTSTVVIVPGLWGHIRRLRERFYLEENNE